MNPTFEEIEKAKSMQGEEIRKTPPIAFSIP